MMPLPSVTKLCFNSNCRQVLDRSRKGWRRRTGEFADLCDRCASAYEEGKFCESFHLNASGWRCCESCGKQIHCGCIVSFHTFVLLDAGGIECMACARTSFILTPNPAWPPPTLHLPGLPDKTRDHSVKSWSSIAGAGPLPWQQAPSSFNNNTVAQVELNPKISPEVDVTGGIDRLYARERFSACSLDKKKHKDSERLVNGSLKTGALETTENEVSGSKCERQPTTYANVGQQLDFPNNGPPAHISPILNSPPKTEIVDQNKISGAQGQRAIPPPGTDKHFPISVGVDSTSEARTHDGKPRGDARVRKYFPKITDQELQEISGDSNTVITPLFEKILSASDAGRIGRLVLPKKCAEAYLPAISNSEGIPLMMQDLKGREWIFQFRFWPNNNSRMYVLEGVTPCIHSMQLVAGDTITFSRLEPEGKLVMGCRKTSTSPRDQNTDTVNTGNGVSTHREAIFKASKPVEVVTAHLNVKDNPTSASLLTSNQTNTVDPSSRWSEADKSKYIAKEPFFQSKRKNSTLGTKSKRPHIGSDQIIELKLTLGEAQRLFRPPSSIAPKILVIEGCEIAEFEEPPIIGRPTILATDDAGTFQWAQCEDCFKWRKVPGDILFPSRWTCSENLWDPERSLCSAAPELPPEELDNLLITAGANKVKAGKEATDSVDATDGLDELANLAINEEGDFRSSSFQTTTKHPRHRPGCTCIVCIQAPSGKGPKHKPTCSCNVCSTVKRRFHTVMSRRGKKHSRKEAESAPQKLQQPEQLIDVDTQLRNDTGKCSQSHEVVTDDGMGHDIYQKKLSLSPFTGHIDLNMQPEREEDLSAVPDSGGMLRLLQFAKERYLEQQKGSNTEANRNSLVSLAEVGVGNSSNIVPLDSHDDNKELDPPLTISAITS